VNNYCKTFDVVGMWLLDLSRPCRVLDGCPRRVDSSRSQALISAGTMAFLLSGGVRNAVYLITSTGRYGLVSDDGRSFLGSMKKSCLRPALVEKNSPWTCPNVGRLFGGWAVAARRPLPMSVQLPWAPTAAEREFPTAASTKLLRALE
jgi:hypothetical protein